MIHNGKAKIVNLPGMVEIRVPSKKNWFILLFGLVWLGGWAMGLTNVLKTFVDTQMLSDADWFILFWLMGWTLGGLAIIFVLLWGFFGREKIILSNNQATLRKTILGIGMKKSFPVQDVTNFRYEPVVANRFGNNGFSFWGLGPGKVKFDYGFKSYSLGLALDEPEARHIADLLNEQVISA